MIRSAIKTTAILSFFLLFVLEMSAPKLTLSAPTCSDGTGLPPFLGAESVSPNVLLMLDNSASMLDLAAVGEEGICFDGTRKDAFDVDVESYDYDDIDDPDDPDDSYLLDYGGYFRPYDSTTASLEDPFYIYDLVDGRFERAADFDAAKTNCTDAAGTYYYLGDGAANGTVCVNIDETDPLNKEVLAFSARGNFLNWAASSKLDIQKKVLTGGKYNSDNQEIILESRGCLNHRYVKKIAVQTEGIAVGSLITKYLTLGIVIPDEWKNETVYPANSVVQYNDTGYYTVVGGTAIAGVSSGPAYDTGVIWVERDYADLTQIEIFEVTDTGFVEGACEDAIKEMASDKPSLGKIKDYIKDCLEVADVATTLLADSNAIFNQTTQDCWYMTKHGLEAWLKVDELDPEAIPGANVNNIKNGCENVYDGLALLGDTPEDILSGNTGYACFGVHGADEQGYIGRCWDLGASASCTDEACADQPDTGAEEICDDRDGDNIKEVYYCPGNYNAGKTECKLKGNEILEADWPKKVNCVGISTEAEWGEVYTDGDPADSEQCIIQALVDYCGYFETPEVIDPSDQEGSVSGDFYNAPAILMEAATEAQLGKSLLTMNGRIYNSTAPLGILHENADRLRFGAMAFNNQGQATECDATGDVNLLKDCSNKLDGAQVISYMDISDAHTTQLLQAINDIKGTAWTPLAEAMYTTIGYFSQDTSMRLNPSDFLTQTELEAAASPSSWATGTVYDISNQVIHDTFIYIANSAGTSCGACDGPESDDLLWTKMPSLLPDVADPIEAYCQLNNVLIITEGASTVDINNTVGGFVATNNDGSETDADSDNCGKFKGSTWLDDLAWYGWQGNMWGSITGKTDYENIRTWVVEGAKRTIEGVSGECQPSDLLTNVAYNGSLEVNEPGAGDDTFTPKFEAGSSEVQFRKDLKDAFFEMLERTSSGSAASVISASRSGEGALYQAIFWPATNTDIPDTITGEPTYVQWTGEVHSFLVDKDGNLREDTNGDEALDELIDEKVTVFYNPNTKLTKACYGSIHPDTKACCASIDPDTGICSPGTIKDIDEVKYLWNVADWLNNTAFEAIDFVSSEKNIVINRPPEDPTDPTKLKFKADNAGVDTEPKRYIFTWNDLNNDGVVDDDEVLPFTKYLGDPLSNEKFPLVDATALTTRGPVHVDFGIDPNDDDADLKVNRIINWIRGSDQDPVTAGTADSDTGVNAVNDLPAMRSRKMMLDWNHDGTDEVGTWKLGDVIHSTPITVAAPAENYNQLYRDVTYAKFSKRWLYRRHMVYFGGNDGMLHAVNGGFYQDLERKFCRKTVYEVDTNGNGDVDAVEDLNGNDVFDVAPVCVDAANTAALGEEMWGYVPYNLLPHLSCLTEPDYEHKYFVDLRPRIFDVQIFEEEDACKPESYTPANSLAYEEPECIHPGGWGTILVGGMRFGGAPVDPIEEEDLNGDTIVDANEDWNGNNLIDEDNRVLKSAYFILDITNPERVPTLLGEMTYTNIQEDLDDDGVLDIGIENDGADHDGDGIPDNNGDNILDGEISIGYTTTIATMVPMNDGTNPTEWHLILGSGPTSEISSDTALKGTSDQGARLATIPLHDRMNPVAGLKSMRVPAARPVSSAPGSTDLKEFGTIHLLNEDGSTYEKSFISDLITVDLETTTEYKADVVYFGTISGDWTNSTTVGLGTNGWGGRLYRLVTRKPGVLSNGANQVVSTPSEWITLLNSYNQSDGVTPLLNPNILYDPDQPIVSAPTVGTDGIDFWVYFGTGRFFAEDDKTDVGSNATQSFYGIREPIGCAGGSPPFQGTNWFTVPNLIPPVLPDSTDTRGNIGLLPVGDVAIKLTQGAVESMPGLVGCYADSPVWVDADPGPPAVPGYWTDFDRSNIEAGSADCLGSFTSTHPIRAHGSFGDLVQYVVGDSIYCSDVDSPGFDGWSRDFKIAKERNLGQATLLGGLISYSSYIPDSDICNPEGEGYLYGVYYQTGTSWFKDVFGRTPEAWNQPIEEGIYMGKGLSTTPNIHVGRKVGGKAFIQTSVGQIVEIPQPNLPVMNTKSGRIKWRDIE